MNVHEAREIGRRWIQDNRAAVPGYCGAIFSGSSLYFSRNRDWPTGSDLDINMYQINPGKPLAARKIPVDGVVLEISCRDFREVSDPRTVLAAAYVAPQFYRMKPVDDPYGLLAPVHRMIREHYTDPRWVRERLRAVRRKAAWNYRTVIDATDASVFGKIHRFIGGVHNTAVLLAVANFGNPTLRRCLAVSDIALHKCGAPALQEELLGILGSRELPEDTVRRHLEQMSPLFDRALACHKTPFWCDRELFPENKAKLWTGVMDMIDEGHHREAVFFLFFMHHCFQNAIRKDGTKRDKARYVPLFDQLAELNGLTDYDCCRQRAHAGLKVLDRVYKKAKELLPE